jgi:hypothetical protein
MQHLDSERLAAFDDTPPAADELAHLAQCADCRAERLAYAKLAQLAADARAAVVNADTARVSNWGSLSRALRDEGLLTSAPDHRVPEAPLMVRTLDGKGERIARTSGTLAAAHGMGEAATPRRESMPAWMRSAAALLLFAGGMVGGRLSVGAAALPLSLSSTASVTTGGNAGQRERAQRNDGPRGDAPSDAAAFGSISQATDVLNSAQRQYEQASLWLAANDTTVRASDVYRARLAALDQMMAASRAALREAPADPVLNRYFLAASTARQATLQQLSSALPVDKSIEGY